MSRSCTKLYQAKGKKHKSNLNIVMLLISYYFFLLYNQVFL